MKKAFQSTTKFDFMGFIKEFWLSIIIGGIVLYVDFKFFLFYIFLHILFLHNTVLAVSNDWISAVLRNQNKSRMKIRALLRNANIDNKEIEKILEEAKSHMISDDYEAFAKEFREDCK